MVSFEGSSYSKGVGLKVAAMWLWHDLPPGTVLYSRGRGQWGAISKPAPWVPYESEVQFEPEVRRMAVLAADEVDRYRSWIRSFRDCAESCDFSDDLIDMRDAAIAWGLARDERRAHSALDRYEALARRITFWAAREKSEQEGRQRAPQPWELEAEQRDQERATRARELRARLSECSGLVELVGGWISGNRTALGLPPFDLLTAVAA